MQNQLGLLLVLQGVQKDAAQSARRGIVSPTGGGHQRKPFVILCVLHETAHHQRRKAAQGFLRGLGSRAQSGNQHEVIKARQGLLNECLIVQPCDDGAERHRRCLNAP